MSGLVGTTWIDGVPVFWRDQPGPLHAQLVFRTGRMDESFVQSGWTHLIEHLALSTVGRDTHDHNGSTGLLTTSFLAHGTEAEVCNLLRAVCRRLAELPMDRLDHEQRVLQIEAEGRAADDTSILALLRYGALGPGSLVLGEFGAQAPDGQSLSDFARSRFSQANAALILSSPPPRGLSLPLPPGETGSTPAARSILGPARHARVVGMHATGLSLEVPRSQAAQALAEILNQRVVRALRDEAGISYSPFAALTRTGADSQHLHVSADSLAEDEPDVARVLVDLLAELGEQGPDAESMDRIASRRHGVSDAPEPDLESELEQHLFPDATRGPHEAPTADDVRALAGACWAGVLLGVRQDDALPEGWDTGERALLGPLGGELVLQRESTERHTSLLITEEGFEISSLLKDPEWEPYGVRWNEVAGVVGYDDGYRRVIRMDASAVTVVPATWLDGAAIGSAIDARVEGRVVHLGPRPEWLVTPQERSLQDLEEARRGVASARHNQGLLKKRAGKAFLLALGAVSAAVLVLGVLVWGIASVAGRVPASFVVALLAGILVAGYRASKREDPTTDDEATPPD